MGITYAYLEIFASITMIVLFVAGLSAKIKLNRSLLMLIMAFSICLVSHALCFLFIENNLILFKIFFFIYMFMLSSCMFFFHTYIITFLKSKLGSKRHLLIYSLAIGIIINVLWLISLFNGFIFYIENGSVIFTNQNLFIILLFIISILFDIILIVINRRYLGMKNSILLIIYIMIPVLATILSIFLDNNFVFVNLSISMAILLNYVFTHMETTAYLIKKDKVITEKNIELADKEHKLVYSQIQPHFLYNVLNTIYYLVDEDKEKGKEAIVSFSDYMRMNLDSLNKPMLIDFADELKKTKTYLRLEKLRFEDELEIVYDIQTTSFLIPQLTLQPVIENAVKHGICKKKGGGTVTIYTREFDKYFEVGVIDDGVGFDKNEKKKDDSRSHVGLSNITYRVENLSHGTVDVYSKIGEGTRVIIKLPKE